MLCRANQIRRDVYAGDIATRQLGAEAAVVIELRIDVLDADMLPANDVFAVHRIRHRDRDDEELRVARGGKIAAAVCT